MFSKKVHTADIKKSILKFQDSKKDSPSRFKHLKIVVEHIDVREGRNLFESNYSSIYYIFYDALVAAENNLKQRDITFHLVHKAHKEELESVLFVFEKILIYCPDIIGSRWQCHSIARILAKLLHPGNSWKLRKEATRFFILWYQALGENAPIWADAMFATLVPGFSSPIPGQPGLTALANPPSNTVFHDPNQGPVSPSEILPVYPPQSGEKHPDDSMKFYLETLLEAIVTQIVKIEWKDKQYSQYKSFTFLFDKFKQYYQKLIFPQYANKTDIYVPNIDLPNLRKLSKDESHSPYMSCRVSLIKWLASFTSLRQPVYQPPSSSPSIRVMRSVSESETPGPDPHTSSQEAKRSISLVQQDTSSTSNIADTTTTSVTEDPLAVAFNIVRQVLYGSRDNINFVHEIFRQGFLFPFTCSPAIRRVIAAYKDWIHCCGNIATLPVFMLEPLVDSPSSPDEQSQLLTAKSRLRNHSYIGAIQSENVLVRAGLQNVLQVFITHSANVFLLEVGSEYPLLLEEQVDICKRVLNIYRYMVMHTNMEYRTWHQLLVVLLRITSLILNKVPPKKKQQTIGGKLAPAVFQTLIVTWIKANLNVVIPGELWDQFLSVLSSLTQWEELIKEWAKTLDTLTRVLARHVYGLDLTDLPLDRLTEQKAKRRRGTSTSRRDLSSPRKLNSPRQEPTTGCIESKECVSLDDQCLEQDIELAPIRRVYSETHLISLESNVLQEGEDEEETTLLYCRLDENTNRWGHRVIRKARSIDCVAGARVQYSDCNILHSRSPSPAPSSGIESNSPLQLDEGGGLGGGGGVSIMSGGGVRGWLPDVAVVLWKRMICALGNVNNIEDAALHAQVFGYLVDLSNTLNKMRLNQGVQTGDTSPPVPPDLVPPLTLVAPWCFEALNLSDKYHRGKLNAYRLLCAMLQDPCLSPQYISQLYRVLHQGMICSDQSIVNTIIKYTGPRFLSFNLPGSSLLYLDIIHACNKVITSPDLRATPRTEAVSMLATLLGILDSHKHVDMLQPGIGTFQVTQCPDAKDLVLNILLRCGKTEPTGQARCIALSSLGIFLHHTLSSAKPQHACAKEALNTLLLALKFNHETVAQIACDVLLSLTSLARVLLQVYPEIPSRIIEVLASTLSYLMPVDAKDKRLLTSLVFCLGEWTMQVPPSVLLKPKTHNPCLLHTVFQILTQLCEGGKARGIPISGAFHQDIVAEFIPNIVLDDLKSDESPTLGRRFLGEGSGGHLSSTGHAVQLAARMIIGHLVNHIGHFPLSGGVARISSLVSEYDDIPQLSSQVLCAPNMQLFVRGFSCLMSLIELPVLEVPGGGITAGLVTAPSQVRVLLRDLGGKSCWDASILYCSPEQLANIPSSTLSSISSRQRRVVQRGDDTMNSCIVTLPQYTMRHRPASVLPMAQDSAPDLDNLDDLLRYIGSTSPECLECLDTTRNIPASRSVINTELEQDTIGCILSERYLESDYVMKHSSSGLASSKPCTRPPSSSSSSYTSFQFCRLLFSQLGLTSWDHRSQLYLLDKNEKLSREIRNLDTQTCRETHKVAVIFVAYGQEDKSSILSNTAGSQAYEEFVSGLAWEVELENHSGFMGGLQKGKTTSGTTAPYYATSFSETLFHVATRMPSHTAEALLHKTRHLGNDEIHIVWSEHYRDYRRGIIPTEFCDVLLVIYPLPNKLYRITISRKPDVPLFAPLFHEAIVEHKILPGLIRATALNASRAKRSMLPFYQQYYEERSRSLDTVVKQHRASTTFEDFTSQVFSPVLVDGLGVMPPEQNMNKPHLNPNPMSGDSGASDTSYSERISPRVGKKLAMRTVSLTSSR
uniref:Probable Rho GTPase-activating protein CG5521 n=2 Tax=Cacopsylla melanoneura TaxID=428564 RepID=A0A8D8VA16_9HEMI